MFSFPALPAQWKRPALYAGAAIVLAAIVVGGRSYITNLAAARAEAKDARAATAQAIQSAKHADSAAAALRTQAAVLDSERAAAVARADSVDRTAVRLRGSYAVVVAQSPDTCRVVVAIADSVLSHQDSVIAALRRGLAASDSARSLIARAQDSTSAALRQLSTAGAALITADAKLDHASKPSFFARLLPHPTASVTAGVDLHGKPDVVAGLGLGWSF